MNTLRITKQRGLLLIGDIFTLALVTAWGFATHDRLGSAGLRLLTTFIPLLVAWLLVSPHLKVFEPERAAEARQLWRPFWAMWLAAPLAAWLRGVMLGSAVLPLFVVILGGFSALAILAWRSLYTLLISLSSRREAENG